MRCYTTVQRYIPATYPAEEYTKIADHVIWIAVLRIAQDI